MLDKEDLSFSENRSEGDFLDSLPEPEEGFVMEEILDRIKSHLVHAAMKSSNGNQSAAARKLGMTPQGVHNFLKRQIVGAYPDREGKKSSGNTLLNRGGRKCCRPLRNERSAGY